MARTLPDKVERLEDVTVQQGLAISSHQSTIDLVVMPMVKRQEQRDEEFQTLRDEVNAALTRFKAYAAIGGGIVTLIGLFIAVWEVTHS